MKELTGVSWVSKKEQAAGGLAFELALSALPPSPDAHFHKVYMRVSLSPRSKVTLGSAVCLMWRRVVAQHSAGVWFSWPIPSPDLSLSCDLSSFASLSPSFSPDSGLDLCWRAVQRFRVLWWQLLWKGQRDFSVGYRIRYTRPHMKPIPDLALSNRKITDKIIHLVLNYWWAAGIWFILIQAGSCQIL